MWNQLLPYVVADGRNDQGSAGEGIIFGMIAALEAIARDVE